MMVDFKFDVSLHRESPEVWLVQKIPESLFKWVELGVLPHSLIYIYTITQKLFTSK